MQNRNQRSERSDLLGGYQQPSNTAKFMEESNNNEIDELSSRIDAMKSLVINIDEALEQDKQVVDGLSLSLNNVAAMMTNTMGSLQNMIETGGSRHMMYLVLFVVGLFVVLYYLMSAK